MSFDQPAPGQTLVDFFQAVIDRRFDRTAGRVLRAIAASTNSGIIRQRLRELAEEAARLDEAGRKLTIDNAVLRALRADLQDTLLENANLIRSAGIELQTGTVVDASAITRQLALPGFTDDMLEGIGVAWNTPDPEAVNQLVAFIDNPAWEDTLSAYGTQVLETVNNQAIKGILAGLNPREIAEQVALALQGRGGAAGLPLSQAENLLRTLQLQSYRTASAITQAANSNILEKVIRVAALDDRTCLSCITLHGTELAVGERVDDHHRGRCVGIAVARGFDRRIEQTGEDWFFAQSDERQEKIAGPANLAALRAGDVSLNPTAKTTFVQPYTDPVFGNMIREASLKVALGERAARGFYVYG